VNFLFFDGSFCCEEFAEALAPDLVTVEVDTSLIFLFLVQLIKDAILLKLALSHNAQVVLDAAEHARHQSLHTCSRHSRHFRSQGSQEGVFWLVFDKVTK